VYIFTYRPSPRPPLTLYRFWRRIYIWPLDRNDIFVFFSLSGQHEAVVNVFSDECLLQWITRRNIRVWTIVHVQYNITARAPVEILFEFDQTVQYLSSTISIYAHFICVCLYRLGNVTIRLKDAQTVSLAYSFPVGLM